MRHSKDRRTIRDAEAIAEAAQRPTRSLWRKTADQLDLQALPVRDLVSQRTGIINQIRAFLLERGVARRRLRSRDRTVCG